MKTLRNTTENNLATLKICMDDTVYALAGKWTILPFDVKGTKADLNSLPISFGHQVVTDSVNVIHPDDVQMLQQSILSSKLRNELKYRFKVITSSRDIQWIEGTGILNIEHEPRHSDIENEIKDQHHLITQIANTVPDMISVMELKTKNLTYINKTNFASQGFEPASMSQKSQQELKTFTHPDDRTVLDTYYKKLEHANDNDIIEADYRAMPAGGIWEWFHVRGKVFQRDAAGTVTHVINVIENISDRKRAEEEINRREELLQATMDSSPDMIQVFKAVRDKNGDIVDFTWILNNHASEKIYGNIIGKSLLENNPGVIEVGIFDTFKRVVESGIPDRSERLYLHEQFNGWFMQSTVKLGDGVATSTTNITEVKKAQQDALLSKKLFQNVIDAPNIGIAVYKAIRDDEGKITDFTHEYINRASIDMLGGEDFTGKLFSDHGENAIHQMPHFIEVVESKKRNAYVREATLLGRKSWFAITNTPLEGDRLVHTWEDITARKNAEQEVRDKQALLQSVFDVSLNPIAYHKAVRDENGKIIDFTFQLENLEAKKYASEDRTGQRYSEAYPGIKDTVVFKMYCDVVDTGNPLNEEVQLSLKNSERWFHLMAVKLDDGLVATALDITDRKKSEHEIFQLKDEIAQKATDKYQALFNSIDQGFNVIELIFDNNGKVIDYWQREHNPLFTKLTGLKDAIGKKMSELVPYVEPEWHQMIENIYYTGKPIRIEYEVKSIGRWYRTYMSRVGGDGSPLIACIYDDITERKQREQYQQFLIKFSDALRAELHADAIANRAIRMIAEHLQLDRCYVGIALLSDNRGVFPYQFGNDRVAPMPEDGVSLSDFPEALRKTYEETLVITDFQRTEGLTETEKQNFASLGFGALVVANVRKEEKNPYWSINAVSASPRQWTAIEIQLVEEATERTWAAVEKAKAENALRESEERQTLLLRLSDSLRDLQNPIHVQNVAMKFLAERLNVERAGYYLMDEDEDGFTVTARYDNSAIPLPTRGRLSSFDPSLIDVYRSRQTATLTDSETLPSESLKQAYRAVGIRSWALVPLVKEGRLITAIGIHCAAARDWTEAELQVLKDVAERTWDAVERAEAEEALRKSEEKFRMVFETMTEACCFFEMIYDDSGKPVDWEILEANPGYERESGLKDVAGKLASTVMPGTEPYWIEMFTRVVETGKPEQIEKWHQPTGRWIHSSTARVGGPGSKRLVSVFYDITERKKAEEALRRNDEKLRDLNARLQETDKAKTAFFNNVSHEFRTPLTLLIGPIEELIKSGGSKLNADDMQKLQFAYRNATRLQKLVTTLLDFARIEAGKLEAYYQPVDFSKLTTELASNFRSAIEKAGLRYVVKTEQISEQVYLNHEMWEKIVFNLLSNAFKFTQKGKIEVIIREKKKTAELRVKDTGCGIAPKDIERIFERFTRIEGTPARTNEGTGIGLALIRELVTAHGGSIKVKSTQKVGTEFIVSIPKGKAHFAKHQIFENRERQPGPDLRESYAEEILGWMPEDVKASRKNLKRYQKEGASRILIVEDNADMREYLSTILAEDDHKILALEDGQKVVTFLEEGGVADLIVADVMMPVLDGFEMIKKLKANPRLTDIPVILLTAKTAEESKIEGLRIGAEAYLTKPFSSKELRAIVMSTLARVHKIKNSG